MKSNSELFEEQQVKDEITQHAKKIDQGFRRLNNTDAQRAIWELFQNSIDLAINDCDIIIELKENGLVFTHNGEVFSPRDLSSLNKQYSLKDIENNDKGVGQYGTGFISTHSFGKSLKIDSSLKFNNRYTDLIDFPINRTYATLRELEDHIENQEKIIREILDTKPFFDSPSLKLTSFKYTAEEEKEINAAKFSFKQVEELIQYVFTFCDKLNAVTLKSYDNNFDDLVYKRIGVGNDETRQSTFFQTNIECNGNTIVTRYIAAFNEDGSIKYKVVFPMENESSLKALSDDTSRLYLFYPLIGSNSFGFNFIIHSKDFFVNEKRSLIELQSDNPKLAEDEKRNRMLMEEISDHIFQFLDNNIDGIMNPIEIATINFQSPSENPILADYLNSFQLKWVTKYLDLKIIETDLGRKKPTEVLFIEQALISDNKHIDDLYKLISHLEWGKPLPKFEIMERWTEIAGKWNSSLIEYISLDKLLEKLEQKTLSDLPYKELKAFYMFIIERGWSEKFEKHKLLPNYKGTLCNQFKLNKGVDMHLNYFDSINSIIPHVLNKLINPDFIFSLSFQDYNRQNLYDDFKTEFDSYFTKDNNQITEQEREQRIHSVTQLCNVTYIQGAKNHRTTLVEKVKDKYGFEINEIVIPNIEHDKFDYDSTPFSTLIRLVANDMLSKTNLQNEINTSHLPFIKDFASTINGIGQHKSLLDNLIIFPNQLGKLCKAIEIAREKDFLPSEEENEFLKNLYKEVIGEDIRKNIVDNYFIRGFESLKNEIEAKTIAGKIEDEFKKEKLDEINIHPHRSKIFEIIKRMTENNSQWPSLFPNLEIKKEIILMSKMTNKDTKNDLFKIISLDDPKRIQILSRLTEVEDLEALINAGKDKQKEDARKSNHLVYINEIGLKIQNLMQNELNSALAETFELVNSKSDKNLISEDSCKTEEKQNGQDFIIYKSGVPFYFIEVKSRWDSKGIIALSKNQVEKCALNKNRYAVISVNVAEYKSKNKNVVEEDISFEQLSEDIRVNLDLSDNFEKLINENRAFEKLPQNTKLIEFRGHIPQDRIKNEGIEFYKFIKELKIILLNEHV